MRQLLYLICFYLLVCLPLLEGNGLNADELEAPKGATGLLAGIHTDDSFPVEELVQDVFVTGACNTISNIEAIGSHKGIGYFQNGMSSIGIERGVVLATGPISNAQGPNSATDKSGDFLDSSGDQDLNIMATGDVKDAVGIEFDFMPLDSIVTFHYVFASEEYCEFVGSIYNDVFGFFITGPGIEGSFSNNARNVALIPGTDDYVSINSVNHQQNTGYYIRNELPEDAALCEQDILTNHHYSEIEYDGFTRKLTAVLHLQPCQSYHIRLVVSDVGDNYYDSAVFLAAESFNLGGKVAISAGTGITPASPSLEGCEDAYFIFERLPGSNLEYPLTVNYTVSGNSSAIPEQDFELMPGYVTIPPNQPFVQVPVSLINEGIAESIEDIILELDIPCACFTDTARMFIADSPPVAIQLDDFGVCENGNTSITPQVQGGSPPYTYTWNTGQQEESISASADGPPVYAVTVLDACGNTAADSAAYFLTEPPEAFLSGEVSICEGDTAYLPLELTGNAPWNIIYSIDGEAQEEISGIYSPGFDLPATLPGLYTLVEVRDASCEGYLYGQASVEVRQIGLEVEHNNISCAGASDGSISVEINEGTPPFTYFWREDIGDSLQVESLPEGTFHLVVTDGSGCQKEIAIEIGSPPPLEDLRPNCELSVDGQLELSASGGTPPYLYSLDGESFFDVSIFNELEAGQTYSISIQDAEGCMLQQEFIMPASFSQMVSLPESIEANLGTQILIEPELHIPESLIGSIRWTPSEGLGCSDCLSPELMPTQPASYTLRVVDIYGCSAEASINIRVNDKASIFIPTAFSPNGDDINDQFAVYANTYQVTEILSFTVFDRWGGLVFKRKNFPPNEESAGWDGICRNQPMPSGVYTYIVEAELVNGNRQMASGHVVLMR